jgi:DNA primase
VAKIKNTNPGRIKGQSGKVYLKSPEIETFEKEELLLAFFFSQ